MSETGTDLLEPIRCILVSRGWCCRIDDSYLETQEVIFMGKAYPAEVFYVVCIHECEELEWIADLTCTKVADMGLRLTVVRHSMTNELWVLPRSVYDDIRRGVTVTIVMPALSI